MPEDNPQPKSHPTPRLTLFSTTFWEILPSHYTSIGTRFSHIAHLHSQTHTAVLATDRAAALNSLKAELNMLEQDLDAYRTIVRAIDITDIAGVYVVAGMDKHRALQLAKQDLDDLEGSLGEVEDKMGEVRAGLRYGVGTGEGEGR